MASDQSFDDEEVATAVGLHVLGEFTVAEGAERLGIEAGEFREILVETGVLSQHRPETSEDVEEEIDVACRVGVEPEDDPQRVLERMDRLVADAASEGGDDLDRRQCRSGRPKPPGCRSKGSGERRR